MYAAQKRENVSCFSLTPVPQSNWYSSAEIWQVLGGTLSTLWGELRRGVLNKH